VCVALAVHDRREAPFEHVGDLEREDVVERVGLPEDAVALEAGEKLRRLLVLAAGTSE
jgi:hypothetical protein